MHRTIETTSAPCTRSVGRNPTWSRLSTREHIWFDRSGHTFHLLLRAHTGSTNLACLAKAVETPDGQEITVDLEKAPSGEPMLYLPLPGGQMRFFILYDEPTRLYWMISTQTNRFDETS